MLLTLRLNGIPLAYTQAELIALGLDIANGTLGYNAILNWIIGHKKILPDLGQDFFGFKRILKG